MKKIIALVLSLLMLLGTLTACAKGDDTETGDETAADSAATTYGDNLPDVDMNEFEFGILAYNDEWFNWAEIKLDVENYSADLIDEQIYKRNFEIEERFNCYLNVMTEKDIQKTDIENLALSGDTSAGVHVVMYYDKWVTGSASYFRDWDDVGYIDLSKDYWNPGITQMFDINGKQVAISGVFSLGMLSRTECVLFDKQMYANFSANDESMYKTLYEYVDKDEWTLETFYQIAAKAVYSSDDTWDANDTYGISASKKELYTSLMIGSGIRFVVQNNEGMPEFVLDKDASSTDKLQKLLTLNQNNDIHYDKSTNSHYADPENFFESGHTLFGVRAIFDIQNARQTMEAEFGIVPVPKYDSAQTEYYSACFGGDVACLMTTVTDAQLENIGIIMEALAYHSQEKLVPTYKTELLQTRYASDMESSSMLDIIFNSAHSDMGVTVLEDTISYAFIQAVYVPEDDTISSTLASMKMTIPGKLKTTFRDIK